MDLLWSAGQVVVEVDGYRCHASRDAFTVDRQRDFELLVSGYLVLRLAHEEVLGTPDRALDKIVELRERWKRIGLADRNGRANQSLYFARQLGLMIEILCGVLTGAAVSHEIASLYGDFSRPSNLGHLFVALDISRLMPREDYFVRIGRLLETVKASRLQDGVDEILFPGEARSRSMERQRHDGIPLDAATADRLSALARPLENS